MSNFAYYISTENLLIMDLFEKTPSIVSEYEELLKAKEFYYEKEKIPFDCTYHGIYKALEREYASNLKEKLNRWIDITHARYFKFSVPVLFYFQAKMLFRDGYFEATIMLARSICEMICYDYLNYQAHPFGNIEQLEQENFRTLIKFLAIPKSIDKDVFEKDVIAKLSLNDDKNFIKSSYQYESASRTYKFNTSNGKEARTLNRYHNLFDQISFEFKENFPGNTFQIINQIYSEGNTYVHARKSPNMPLEDATKCLNDLGLVLAHLYTVDGDIRENHISTGYSFFPDICQGSSFGMDVYLTEEDAIRGYYNLPSQRQIDQVVSLEGIWQGRWKTSTGEVGQCHLHFYLDGEYLMVDHFISDVSEQTPIIIKLYGDDFHLLNYDDNGELVLQLELEILDSNTLLGQNLITGTRALFTKR